MNKNKQENFIQEQLTEKEKINKSIFYFMFAPWCGYSKKVLPVWEEIVKSKQENVEYIKVDSSAADSQEILKKYNVEGFPTFILQPSDTHEYHVYDGSRSLHSLNDFISAKNKKKEK